MGDIETLYYRNSKLPPRDMSRAFFIDIAENIHIHYRDLRMEFSRDEYFHFMQQMNELYDGMTKWREENPTWVESDPETFDNKSVEWVNHRTPKDTPLKAHSDYWDGRISIEKNVNGIYHIHWRNYRFEMGESGFKEWVRAFEVTAATFEPSRRPRTSLPKFIMSDRRQLLESLKRVLQRVPLLVRVVRFFRHYFPLPPPLPVDPLFYRHYLSYRRFASSIERVKLGDLRVALWQGGHKTLVPIQVTPASRYLRGEERVYAEYCRMQNYSGPRNVSRFRKLIRSIDKTGINGRKLIVTRNRTEILDGQHRAAIYLHMFGESTEIQVVDISDVIA